MLQRINLLFAWAATLAADTKAKDSSREAAIRLLGRAPENQKENLQLLARLLDSSAPVRLQNTALDTLKRNRSPEVSGLLLSSWTQLSPSLRQASLEVLLSRDPWTKDLLGAIDHGVVGRNEISMANRQRLLKNSNKDILAHVQEIWKSEKSSSRADVVAHYQSALTLAGDAVKGATLFANNCTVCHYLRGQGNNVGPNLGSLTDKTPSDFLTAILDPNAAVEPRFIAYNIETKDGRSLTGVVSAETGTTLTLVQGGGTVERILRSDIQEIRASGLSMMPEGLEQNLSPQDLADLIAYLNTAPHPFGSATPEQAATAKKKFLSSGVNGVSQVSAAAERLPYPSWMGELSMSSCRQTDGQSRLAWQTAPVPAGLKPDAIHEFRLPVAMGFASQRAGTFSLRLNGKPMLDFNITLHDQSWHSADGKIQMSYTVMEDNSEDSNGILAIRVAASLLEPGKPANFEVIGSAANSQRWFGIYLLATSSARAAR
jgi:putative heme-binding domain-containing protein